MDITSRFTCPRRNDVYGGNAQAFLKYFARRAHGTGERAADVRVVRAIRDVERMVCFYFADTRA